MNKLRLLNNNHIKIIAAVTMFIDHFGLIFFPRVTILRIIGRLSFPLFAFMIAEGTRYTKNKIKYLSMILALGVICQIPVIIMDGDYHWNVLVTFSLSILAIYAIDFCKKTIFDQNTTVVQKALSLCLGAGVPILLFVQVRVFPEFHYAYGFYGCMVAVFAALPNTRCIENPPAWLARLDNVYVRVVLMAIPMTMYCLTDAVWYQVFSFFTLIFLLLYSGKKGKYNMKYFFYVFYPAHLIILYGIHALL